jgi:hypothetical protein
MKISITGVKFSIPFMFPDPSDLRQKLHQALAVEWSPTNEFFGKFGEADLCFIIVLSEKTKELEVKGPTKGMKMIDYTLWLPYKRIKAEDNYRNAYLAFIKEGVFSVLAKYNFNLEPFVQLFDEIENDELNKR